MVLIIWFLSALATSFVLSVIYTALQLEGLQCFIAFLLCAIYLSDKVSMHYVNKYLQRKQAMEMRERIKLLIEKIEDEEDEHE